MKILIFVLTIALCSQVSFGFLAGASKVIPEIANIIKGINNASEAGANVTEKVCVVTKTILKFEMETFVNATQALSNLQFNLKDVQNFYSYFLTCLNEQSTAVTAGITKRNLQHLVFIATTYVLPGISNINKTASSIGEVFGADNTAVFMTFAEDYKKIFDEMVIILTSIIADFDVAISSGVEITYSNLEVYVNTTTFKRLTTCFRRLTVSTQNLEVVVSGFTSVTEVIESFSSDIQVNATATTESYSSSARTMSLTINNSKQRFVTRTEVNVVSIAMALISFEDILTKVFLEDSEFVALRDEVRSYYINASQIFYEDNTSFQKLMVEFDANYTLAMTEARKENDKSHANSTGECVKMCGKSKGSAGKCFGKKSKGAINMADIMRVHRTASENCTAMQVEIAIQAQTLKTFINEDVVLNFMGASDELCGCIIKGDKNVNAKSKKCVKDTVAKIKEALKTDTEYIKTETKTLKENLAKNIEVFKLCTKAVGAARDQGTKEAITAMKACSAN